MKEEILNYFKTYPAPLAIVLIAMLPVFELRLAIPVGILFFNLNPAIVFLLAVIGNLIPIVFILLFLKKIENFLKDKSELSVKFFNWLYARTHKKGSKKMKKWGHAAIILFVAIPLPMTGAWTGSLLAILFEVPFYKALALITTGVIIAGIVVTAITVLGLANVIT